MYDQYYSQTFFIGIMVLVAAWTIPWKVAALWKAARQGQGVWFVALLLINTLALLEILYIFVFSKRNKNTVHNIEDNK